MAYKTISPDGRRWEIKIQRMHLPGFYDSSYDPWSEGGDPLNVLIGFVILAPIFWVILPLVRAIALLPLAFVRSLFSQTRWIEAVCASPSEIKIVWKTSRDQSESVAQQIAERLHHGNDALVPAGATLVSMTMPPGP